MTKNEKRSLKALLRESFLFSMELEYAIPIIDSILDDVAQDIYEAAGKDYDGDDIRSSVGRILCKRLNLENIDLVTICDKSRATSEQP